MKADIKEFESFPELMSKEQFCKACHISKRTALHLLQNDLIPYESNGKRTRCYSIRKSDVIDYLTKLDPDVCQEKNDTDISSAEVKKASRSVLIKALMTEHPVAVRRYFARKMAAYHDVMNVTEVTDFIGYNRKTIGRWISTGKLKALKSMNKHMIPKIYLLDFMMTDAFNEIVRKTPKHSEMVQELIQKKARRISLQEKRGIN